MYFLNVDGYPFYSTPSVQLLAYRWLQAVKDLKWVKFTLTCEFIVGPDHTPLFERKGA